MFNRIRRALFGRSDTTGKSNKQAMSRLSFVLVQDRTGLTAPEMSAFKSELMGVLEKYFVVDKQGFDVTYKRENNTTKLVIDSPIVVRRQDVPGGSVGSERVHSSSKGAKGKASSNKEGAKENKDNKDKENKDQSEPTSVAV